MDRIDELVTDWEKFLGDIVKLLARNGISIPAAFLAVSTVPGLTQAAVARTVTLLMEGDSPVRDERGAKLTAVVILKWLATGLVLEEIYADPLPWRVPAAELMLDEVQLFAGEASVALDLRDSQN